MSPLDNLASRPVNGSNPLPEYTVVGEDHDSILEHMAEIWRYRALIVELLRRDLNIRYKNRVGGILWSLFPPLLQVLTLTIMVKLFLAPVNNYSAYLMAVIFLWQFFMNAVLDSSNSILINQSLIRKIYFPRAIMPIVSILTNLLHFGVSLILIFLYFFIIPFRQPIYPKNITPAILWVIPSVLGLAVLALGVGFITARMTTLYEDVRFLGTTFFGLFFYAMPILYPIERVAAHPNIYAWYMLNPTAVFLVAFQRALLPPLPIDGEKSILDFSGVPVAHMLPAFAISIFILCIGFYSFERSKWMMIERM